jgi:hypothetical protein
MKLRPASRTFASIVLFLSSTALIAAASAGTTSTEDGVNSLAINAGETARQPKKPGPDVVSSGNAVLAIPLSKLSMTRDRPIFSPSRRPPPPLVATPVIARPVERAKPPEPENPPLMLVGTVVGEDTGIAVLVEQATENVVKLRVNDSHQGWTLRSVQGREVTFQKESKSSVLALAPPGGSGEPASSQASLEPPKKSSRR